jgi:DNA-binding CsgD family transcriptional regulator
LIQNQRRSRVINRIIGEIYDAAGDVDRWGICLQSIRDLFGATAAHLVHHDHRSHDGGISAAAGLDPAAIQAYATHYHAVDPWALKVKLDAAAVGSVVLGQSLIAHRDMIETEYYHGLGKPHDLTRAMISFLERPSSTGSANLSLNRSDHAPEFTVHDLRLMQLLVPHLQRAVAIHRRFSRLDAQRAAAASVIDRLTCGVILVDVRLRPVQVNAVANQILSERDGLVLDRDTLTASTAAQTTALRHLVAGAAAVTAGIGISLTGGAIRIGRRSPREPLQVLVTPVSAANHYTGAESLAVAAIFVTDPAHTIRPNERVLQTLYGFTPAESRIAAALASGLTLGQIAQSLNLTIATARWYVKQLRAKTGASTQAQLVRQLIVGPGSIK